MTSILSYIFLGFVSVLLNIHHPVHIALTSIEYTDATNSIDIAVKLNTEDIELAIAHNYEVLINLHKPNELKEIKKHIENYFSHTLQVLINDNQKLTLSFNKDTDEENSTWFYFSFPYTGEINKITIKNAILLDIFMDQTNVTILSHNGKEIGYKLDFNNREITYIPKKETISN